MICIKITQPFHVLLWCGVMAGRRVEAGAASCTQYKKLVDSTNRSAIHAISFRNYLLKMVNLKNTNKSENKRFKHSVFLVNTNIAQYLKIVSSFSYCRIIKLFIWTTVVLPLIVMVINDGVMETSQIWKHETYSGWRFWRMLKLRWRVRWRWYAVVPNIWFHSS